MINRSAIPCGASRSIGSTSPRPRKTTLVFGQSEGGRVVSPANANRVIGVREIEIKRLVTKAGDADGDRLRSSVDRKFRLAAHLEPRLFRGDCLHVRTKTGRQRITRVSRSPDRASAAGVNDARTRIAQTRRPGRVERETNHSESRSSLLPALVVSGRALLRSTFGSYAGDAKHRQFTRWRCRTGVPFLASKSCLRRWPVRRRLFHPVRSFRRSSVDDPLSSRSSVRRRR